jgi:hypothetical protein
MKGRGVVGEVISTIHDKGDGPVFNEPQYYII